MGIEVEWLDDEKTIMIWRFLERYEWDDLAAALDVAEQMVDEVDHIISLITDYTLNRKGPPPHLLSQFPKLVERAFRRDLPQVVVAVGARGLTSTFNRIFSKLYIRLEVADTMDEALAIIREHRSAEGQ